MVPFHVHLIAFPLNGLLLGAICVAAARVWGPGWPVVAAGAVGFVPAFIIAHGLADLLDRVARRAARLWSRGR